MGATRCWAASALGAGRAAAEAGVANGESARARSAALSGRCIGAVTIKGSAVTCTGSRRFAELSPPAVPSSATSRSHFTPPHPGIGSTSPSTAAPPPSDKEQQPPDPPPRPFGVSPASHILRAEVGKWRKQDEKAAYMPFTSML